MTVPKPDLDAVWALLDEYTQRVYAEAVGLWMAQGHRLEGVDADEDNPDLGAVTVASGAGPGTKVAVIVYRPRFKADGYWQFTYGADKRQSFPTLQHAYDAWLDSLHAGADA